MTTARRSASILVLLLGSALARPVAAQHNRLFNSDLDGDAVGWEFKSAPGTGGWDFEDRDGCEGSGSGLISGDGLDFRLAYILQCIPVFAGETLYFEIEARLLFASEVLHSGVFVMFTNGGCASSKVGDAAVAFGELPPVSWTRGTGHLTVPAAAVSAWVFFELVSNAPFDALLDGAYAAEGPARLFNDGFEYGSNCRW
jgi:hypothetical protein